MTLLTREWASCLIIPGRGRGHGDREDMLFSRESAAAMTLNLPQRHRGTEKNKINGNCKGFGGNCVAGASPSNRRAPIESRCTFVRAALIAMLQCFLQLQFPPINLCGGVRRLPESRTRTLGASVTLWQKSNVNCGR